MSNDRVRNSRAFKRYNKRLLLQILYYTLYMIIIRANDDEAYQLIYFKHIVNVNKLIFLTNLNHIFTLFKLDVLQKNLYCKGVSASTGFCLT